MNYDVRFIVRNSSVVLHFWIYNKVILCSWHICTNFGTWSYRCLFYNISPISLHILQCSSAHPVACLCMYCSFPNTVHTNMTRSICYSAVQHKLYHVSVCTVLFPIPYIPIWPVPYVTVQFSTHCSMSLYVLFFSQYCTYRYDPFHMLQCSLAQTVSCLCMYCSFPNTVHTDMTCSICYSAVHHTLYHVSVCTFLFPILYIPIWPVPYVTVQFSTQCIMSLYVLFLSQYCSYRYDPFHCLIKLFTFYICSLLLFVIFLSTDIRFAMSDLVLLLFHFQSLISDLLSTTISTCLLHQ